ncbi:MAG: hypothetical protein M1434_14305 [Chloroflexi bacterium]|nr:hypothetical protein [Chloroflexota bacterium]MCL5275892.1 hypothetical protein [Chloroflexota bacterium]
MDILGQLTSLVRAKANDLLRPRETRQQPADPRAESIRLLKAAQQRADRLGKQLSQAEARERNAEQAWRDARSQSDTLELEVNAATRAGQDDVARAKLAQLNQAQNHVQQLSDRWHDYATASEKLRIEIQDLQAQLNAVRQRLAGAGGPASTPAQGMAPAQRQSTTASQPATEAIAREERLATPQDKPAAPKDLDTTRIADLLKKRDQ